MAPGKGTKFFYVLLLWYASVACTNIKLAYIGHLGRLPSQPICERTKVSIAHFLLLHIRTTHASIQVFVFLLLAIETCAEFRKVAASEGSIDSAADNLRYATVLSPALAFFFVVGAFSSDDIVLLC